MSLAFFDSLAERWDSLQTPRDFEAIREILERAGVAADDRVLDVGAGTGVLVPFLRERGVPEKSIVAVEPSMGMGRELLRKHPDVTLLPLDFCSDIPLNGFSIVIIFNAFPHLEKPVSAFSNATRALRPGGRLVVAHSLTREELDALHGQTHADVAEHVLASDAAFRNLFHGAGLVLREIANHPYFYAEGHKENAGTRAESK